ncbi:MAG TPA: hypothetical protein VGE93_06305, partial [Bryobacteraceae bacterium]
MAQVDATIGTLCEYFKPDSELTLEYVLAHGFEIEVGQARKIERLFHVRTSPRSIRVAARARASLGKMSSHECGAPAGQALARDARS